MSKKMLFTNPELRNMNPGRFSGGIRKYVMKSFSNSGMKIRFAYIWNRTTQVTYILYKNDDVFYNCISYMYHPIFQVLSDGWVLTILEQLIDIWIEPTGI